MLQVHSWKTEKYVEPQQYTLTYSRDSEGIQLNSVMLSLKEWRILHEEIGKFLWHMEWTEWKREDEETTTT